MTAFIGMSPEKGNVAAETIEGQGTSLALACEDVMAAVQGAEWMGEDREQFLRDYATMSEAVNEFHRALVTQGGLLREQAKAQALASAASSGVGQSAVAAHGNASAA